MGSNSSRLLAKRFTELRGRRVFQVARDSATYVPRRPSVYLNWGCSSAPTWARQPINCVNQFDKVARAGNKLLTFQALAGKPGITIPEFTNDKTVAQAWGVDIVCRSVLNGHSGAGITIQPSNTELPNVPLYVKYIKKQKEFRVHVIFGQVVDVQQKKKREGFENANFQVRNHANGWVYCRENISEPEGLRESAVRTIEELGLDFGAVDIIWNERQNQVYVLEVNTAPGLEGNSVNVYAENIWRKLNAA